MPLLGGNWCLRCGALDEEPARLPACTNPMWHIPNANGVPEDDGPDLSRVRLPYAEDRD